MTEMPKNAPILKAPANVSVFSAADGTWLYFTTSSGKSASLCIESIAQDRGPIVRAALLEWCKEQSATNKAEDRRCQESAGHLIAGHSEFVCVLPRGHEPSTHPDAIDGHVRGGKCYAHGEYIGAQCPQWPRCITDKQVFKGAS